MPHPYDSCLACDSFSTTISSVNFFGKSIPLPFFFVFFFQCKYFLFVLIWFTKGDPPPLDNIQVLMPNDYIVQLYHRHCYIAHSSWITQLHIKFLSKYFYLFNVFSFLSKIQFTATSDHATPVVLYYAKFDCVNLYISEKKILRQKFYRQLCYPRTMS